MPVGYGGGISNVDQAKHIFSLGVEKVCLQTSVLKNFNIVTDLASMYGNQSILVSVDIKRDWLGKLRIYSHATNSFIKKPWKEFLQEAILAGAGEIVLNNVDKDGTMLGLDLALIKDAANEIDVPLIAVGGANSLDDIKKGVVHGADAVAAGAFFVFQGPHKAVLITYPKYQELVDLFNSK
jgi:cyclase